VIDSIIDEEGYKYVKEASFTNETKRGHFGRPTIISLVKKIPLPLFTEVMTDGTYVYLLNHSKSHYEIINSTVLASTYIALIEFLKIDSRKLTQQEIWEQINQDK
jgi:DNA-binding beta-propeller fold protein YncE